MTAFRFVSMVPCVVLMTATIAAAQQGRPASSAPFDNGYMTGAAGASFSDTQSVTFGIEIGETINPRVQATPPSTTSTTCSTTKLPAI
jgi:hypothetical protein